MDFNDLVKKFEEEKKDSYDSTIPVTDLRFISNGSFKLSIKGKDFPLLPTGMKTLCQRIQIPYEYFSRNPLKDTARHVNYWLENCKFKELYLRVKGDSIRGVLNPKFEPYDTLDMLMDLAEVVKTPRLMNYYEDRWKSDVRLSLSEEYNYGMGEDKKFRVGVIAMNSELDDTPFQLNLGITRLKCMNDVIQNARNSRAYFKKPHRSVARQAILAGIQTSVNVMRDEGEARAKAFSDMSSRPLSFEHMDRIYNELEDKRVFQKTFIYTVRKTPLEEPTFFGLANQLTAGAKNLSFGQRRSVEEFVGSKLLAYASNI